MSNSCMTRTASGCTSPDGFDPADRACQDPPPSVFQNASAIWDRQEFPVHRMRTRCMTGAPLTLKAAGFSWIQPTIHGGTHPAVRRTLVSLPDCRQFVRFRAEALRYDKATGLRKIEHAAVGYHCPQTLAGIDGRAGRDELTVRGQIDHVHVGTQHVGFGQCKTATGVVMTDAVDDFAGLAVEDITFPPQGVRKDKGLANRDDI